MPSQPQDKKPPKKKQATRNRSITPAATNEQLVRNPGDDEIFPSQSPDDERPTISQDDQQRQRPETLATLAIQLLQPKLASMRDTRDRLSAASFDSIYHDALVRADSLLNLAAGLADEEIHVYQLFKENSEPLSFEAIAARFKEVSVRPHKGMPTSKNTVEDRVRELLHEAQQKIADALDEENAHLSLGIGEPIDLVTLRKKIRRHMRLLIGRTRLGRAVKNPSLFADDVSKFFIKRLGEAIDRGQPYFVEYSQSSYGEYEFIEHVCGLSYEEFTGKNHLGLNLSFDETNAILFYLEQLGAGVIGRPENRDEIKKLTSLFIGSSEALQSVVRQMTECGEKLGLEDPDLDGAKRCALQAAQSLALVLDHWLFRRFWRMLPVFTVKAELLPLAKTLADEREADCNTDECIQPTTLDDVRSFVEILDKATELAKPDAIPVGRAEYLDLLKDISNGARFIRMSENPHVRPVLSNELTGVLEKFAAAADNGIYLEKVRAPVQWQRIEDLLKAEKRTGVPGKVKAYELFLFAAEAGIQKNRYVIRRSDLKASCKVNAKHDLREKVVWSYGRNWLSTDTNT